ncbi:MAG: glycosyltransferase family 9 protein [candidate division Zixibacteria bacterium]|nr:glycosyltransferase family 9 protein [candidate division Zixibacteria bacterium]
MAESHKFRRALFIQIKQAGDCLLSTPALRAFKKAYPDCEIDFLVGKYSTGILQGNPSIDNLITVDNWNSFSYFKWGFKLRKQGYDIVVDFLSSPTSSKLTILTGAKIRAGYKLKGRSWVYTHLPTTTNPDDYSAKDKLRLLEPFGIKENGLSLDFYLPQEETEKARDDIGEHMDSILAVVPVSRRIYKRWPEENYAKLLDMAVDELELMPLLLCGPGEMEFLETITSKMTAKPIVREMKSFQQFGAYFSISKMVLGNDNGPKHIAVALGIPTLTIMGHLNPLNWTEPDNPKHTFIRNEHDCQAGCQPKKCPDPKCIAGINPEEVYEQLKQHWQKSISDEIIPD